MKLSTFVILFFVHQIIGEENYDEFESIDCSASSITCQNTFCKVNNDNGHNNTSVSFGCDLKRSIKQISFHIQFYNEHDDGTFDIVTDKTISFCDSVEDQNSHHMHFFGHVKLMELPFGDLVMSCPIDKLKVINGTRKYFINHWPTGRYKTIMRAYDDIDDNILQVIYHEDLYLISQQETVQQT